jgi:hypothetical protein
MVSIVMFLVAALASWMRGGTYGEGTKAAEEQRRRQSEVSSESVEAASEMPPEEWVPA